MYDAIIEGAAAAWDVPASWIRAVIATESDWDARAFRAEPQIGDASYGLMQLLTGTARGLGWTGSDPEELYEPALNIHLGAELLAELRDRHGHNFATVYSAYNSGSPTAWLTSEQVRHNTERALDHLEEYAGAAAGSAAAIVAVVAIVWAARKKRKG